ncbi:MAG: flagellar protein FlgN [Clostridiaceae bacterium]|nr:flagellar protein FlgN [Clostridiaceae bacterium]
MEAINLIKQLNKISGRKLNLLQELESLTFKQKEYIKEKKYDEVDQVIQEKQKLMDLIDKLDADFAIYSQKLKNVLGIASLESLPGFNIEGTKELKEIVGEIYAKLTDIKKQDAENTTLLKNELNETRDRINHNNTFKQVTKAYGPAKPINPSYFFDKKK